MTWNNMKQKKLEKYNYSVEIGYSPEAVEKKLLKFIPKDGKEFEISAEELASMIIGGVNSDTLEATFVESNRIDVVEVGRQLECVLDKDMKKGAKIHINYTHPYPLDFAIIEQAYCIAKLDKNIPVTILTDEYLNSIREKIKPEQKKFINHFYKSFRNLNIK